MWYASFMCCYHKLLDLNMFDAALLGLPFDYVGSKARMYTSGVEPSAKLFLLDWLEHAVPGPPPGPPVPNISVCNILVGIIPPQLMNFCFRVEGILEQMVWVDFALYPKWLKCPITFILEGLITILTLCIFSIVKKD
jgi:hypothetical protein